MGAAIVPHPPIILPEVGHGEEQKISATTKAYETIARRVVELTAMAVHSLNIYTTNGGLCYINAGYHISNVPFTITNVNASYYNGRTTYNWNYTAYWRRY